MVYECGSQMVVMLTLTEELNIKDEVSLHANVCDRRESVKCGELHVHVSEPESTKLS